MRLKKKQLQLFCILLLMLISGVLCACGAKNKDANQEFPATLETVESGTVATSGDFSLEWNKEKSCVLLRQAGTDKVWSTTPYDFYQTDETNEDMSSPIYIEYIDASSMIKVVSKGFSDSVANGRVASRSIENGIEVTYYFDDIEIAVPVQYCLREDALEVTVDFEHAMEQEHALISVSVAPFLCSVQNQKVDSYLVVPSGSGALMYTDERAEGTRTWSGEIYGADAARLLPESLADEEAVRLPIFGVKSGEEALLAIVEDGQEAAVIHATAGNEKTGHSNAYVSFYARGYDVLESKQSWSTRDVYQAEDGLSVDKATVAFYPLSGDEADYTGMASRYQKMLTDVDKKQTETNVKAYALYLYGGAKVKKLFLGVPFSKTKALTTFTDAQTIVCEMSELTGQTPAVQMKGYGKSGLDIGKVAGGFEFADVFGSDSERLELEQYCSEKDIPLYMDFDLVYFNSGGKGYNTIIGVAKSASMRKATQYQKNKALWNYETEEKAYYLLKRDDVQSAVDKLEKTIEKKEISGVSLSTLGKITYSDYSDEKYSARGNSMEDVQAYLKQLAGSGVHIATASANDYAVVLSDSVFDVSLENGGYLSLDVTIPLYQMIFKGYVSMYSTAVNTSADFDKSLMLAVQSGTMPGFAVVGEYDMDFETSYHTDLHASDYDGNKDSMVEAVLKCADYYTAIHGQKMTDYEFVSDEVTKTGFENGVIVYANHSDKTVQTPLGELEAYGFAYVIPEVRE